MPAPIPMPVGLQRAFAGSLTRLPGDVVQQAINQAAADMGVAGLESLMNVYWQLYAAKGRQMPGDNRLQYLYVQRECLANIGRRVFDFTTSTEAGIESSDTDVFKAVMALHDAVNDDIALLEKQVNGSRPGAAAQMIGTAPAIPMPGKLACPDPNNPYYIGSPFFRRGWPW